MGGSKLIKVPGKFTDFRCRSKYQPVPKDRNVCLTMKDLKENVKYNATVPFHRCRAYSASKSPKHGNDCKMTSNITLRRKHASYF